MRFFIGSFLLVYLLSSCSGHERSLSIIPPPSSKSEAATLNASIRALSEVIKNNPSIPDNYFKRAVLNLKAENFEDALSDINRADQLRPNRGEYYFIKSKILNQLGDEKALGFALSAETLDYDQPDLFVLIGELYTRQGELVKAEAYFRKAENLYPRDGDLAYQKGLLYARKGDTLSAVRSYYSAIALKPQVFGPYDQLIRIYNKRRIVDSALAINEMSIKRFPQKKEMVFNKAQILENTGLLDSARNTYERFLELSPSSKEVLGNIGSIYFRKKNYPEALKSFELLIAAQPANATALHMAGRCKEQLGEFDRAREYLEKALKTAPDNREIQADLARVNVKIENMYTIIRPF